MLTSSLPKFAASQRGLGLVELMVGLTISLIVALAAGSLLVTNARGSADALRSAKLNVELRAVMDLMESEIRRAGYSGVLPNNASSQNPFTAVTTDLTAPTTSCVLLTYDVNANGTVETEEYSGFRLTSSSIQMRTGGSAPANNAGCGSSSGSWEGLTDDGEISITTFNIAINYICSNAFDLTQSASQPCVTGQTFFNAAAAGTDLVESRRVTVTLNGQHNADASVRGSLSRVIRVRNDKVVTKS